MPITSEHKHTPTKPSFPDPPSEATTPAVVDHEDEIQWSGLDQGGEAPCTVTLTCSIKYEPDGAPTTKKKMGVTITCQKYKLTIAVVVKDTCGKPFPGPTPNDKSDTATNTSTTTRTFCDDETDGVEPTVSKDYRGEMDTSLIYKHGTKITGKFEKDGKKLTITITFKDQPSTTITLPPGP